MARRDAREEMDRWILMNASALLAAATREAKLREALEFYAEAEHCERGNKAFAISVAAEDRGYRARRALAGEAQK